MTTLSDAQWVRFLKINQLVDECGQIYYSIYPDQLIDFLIMNTKQREEFLKQEEIEKSKDKKNEK